MPPITVASALQITLALGLLNVWLLRPNMATNYRGGTAKNLKEEFATYGLPPAMFYIVGGLKLAAAVAFLVGLWIPNLALAAAGVLIVLMAGAVLMHIKVKDPIERYVPALSMLAMSTALLLMKLG